MFATTQRRAAIRTCLQLNFSEALTIIKTRIKYHSGRVLEPAGCEGNRTDSNSSGSYKQDLFLRPLSCK